MTLFGGDAVQRAVDAALDAVRDGRPVAERRCFDFKEEAGRRGPGGIIGPGRARNEQAAESLAGEVACMANTPGGGALIVGVVDDGTPIGTDLDVDWLQKRLYQLLHQKLATIITEESARGHRLLIIRCPPAVEPLTYAGRTTWRVGDQCHDIDLASWHALGGRGPVSTGPTSPVESGSTRPGSRRSPSRGPSFVMRKTGEPPISRKRTRRTCCDDSPSSLARAT